MLSQERPAQKAFLFKSLRSWCLLASITCVALPSVGQGLGLAFVLFILSLIGCPVLAYVLTSNYNQRLLKLAGKQ